MLRLEPTPATTQTIRKLFERVDALSRPAPADYEPIQEAIRAAFALAFDTESDGDRPWAPLADRTNDEREALGYPREHPILVRSGSYRDSFIEAGHPLHVSEAEIAGGIWRIAEGSTDDRADQLEFGDARTPPRPVTWLGRAGEDRMNTMLGALFAQWFEDAE